MNVTQEFTLSPMDRIHGAGLNSTRNLTEVSTTELISMVKNRGTAIGMLVWEVNMLIEVCVRRRCLQKGFEILLEYAKLQSDIDKFIHKRSAYRDKVIYSLQDEKKLPRYVEKMAEYSLKTWISVLRLRLMQWSPRPINIYTGSVASNVPSNFLFEFNKDIRLLIAKIKEEGGLNLVKCGASIEHLIIMLSTAAAINSDDWTALNDLLGGPESPLSTIHSLADVSNFVNIHSNFLSAIKTAIKVEIASENTVNAFASLNTSRIELLEADKLPLLRIQYGAVPPPPFEGDRTGEEYYNACYCFLDVYYEVFTNEGNRDRTEENDLHMAALVAMAEINGDMTTGDESCHHHKRGIIHSSSSHNAVQQQRHHGGSMAGAGRFRSSPATRHRKTVDGSPYRSPPPSRASRSSARPVSSTSHRTPTEPVPPTSTVDCRQATGNEDVFAGAYYPSQDQWSGEGAEASSRPLDSSRLFSRTHAQRKYDSLSPKKERIVDVTVGILGTRDIMLHIERVRVNIHTSRLVVRGYLEGCSTSTRKTVRLGDEIVGVNGVSVVGERRKQISQLIHEGVGVGASQVVDGSGLRHQVNLRLRRFYEGWEQFAEPVAVTSATVSTTIKFNVSPSARKRPRVGHRSEETVLSVSTPGQNIGDMSFVQLELRVNKLRQDIANVERLMRHANSLKLEKLKTMFIDKYEEMVACERLMQELNRSQSGDQSEGMFASNIDMRAADSTVVDDEDSKLGGKAIESGNVDSDVPNIATDLENSAVYDSVVSDITSPKQMNMHEDESHQQSSPAVATMQVTLDTSAEWADDNIACIGRPQTGTTAEASGASTENETVNHHGPKLGACGDVDVNVRSIHGRGVPLCESSHHSAEAERAAAAAAAIVAFTASCQENIGTMGNDDGATDDDVDDENDLVECDELFDADGDTDNVEVAGAAYGHLSPAAYEPEGCPPREGGNDSCNPESVQSDGEGMARPPPQKEEDHTPAWVDSTPSCHSFGIQFDATDFAVTSATKELLDGITQTSLCERETVRTEYTTTGTETDKTLSAFAEPMQPEHQLPVKYDTTEGGTQTSPRLETTTSDRVTPNQRLSDAQRTVTSATKELLDGITQTSLCERETVRTEYTTTGTETDKTLSAFAEPMQPEHQLPVKYDTTEGGTQTSPRLETTTSDRVTPNQRLSDAQRTVTFSPQVSIRKDSISAEFSELPSDCQFPTPHIATHNNRTQASTGVDSFGPLPPELRVSDSANTRKFSQQEGGDTLGPFQQQRFSDPTRRISHQGQRMDSYSSPRLQQRLSDPPTRPRSWSSSPLQPKFRKLHKLRNEALQYERSPSPAAPVRRTRGDSYDSVEYSATEEWFRRLSRPAPESLRYALQSVDRKHSSKGVHFRAASKIIVWWKLMCPQKKLHRRMLSRAVCLDIVLDVVEVTLTKCSNAHKKRYWMMRQGAAVVIQRLFRHWRFSVLMQIVKIQRAYKRSQARAKVIRLVTCSRAAVMVARFVYRNRLRQKKLVGKKKLYRTVIRNFLEVIGCRARDDKARQINALANISSDSRRTTMMTKLSRLRDSNNVLYLQRFKACIKIQAIFRMAQARCLIAELIRDRQVKRQISVWLSMVRLRKKVRARRETKRAATIIQRFWRGAFCRWKMMINVLAGVRIVSTWRRHRQYWKLKHCLRRNEIPLEVTFHGIRNIPAKQCKSGMIRIRVSVWWSDLLHLVDKDEYMTVLQSKRPNVVRTTSFHLCSEQKVAPKLIMPHPPTITKVGSNRKLSLAQRTKLLVPQHVNSKLDAAAALVQFAKLHGVRGAHVKMAGDSMKDNSDEGSKPAAAASHDSVRARANFQKFVKKSQSIGALMQLQHKVSAVAEDEEDKSSGEENSSSEDDEDDYYDEGDVGQVRPRASSAPKAVQSRVQYDRIGKDSVHALGQNLLGSGSTDSVMGGMRGTAKNILSSLTALDITPALPQRKSLKPVPRKGTEEIPVPLRPRPGGSGAGSGSGSSSPVNVKNMMNSALKAISSVNSTSVSATPADFYRVDLDDEELYLPGLHGNSVVRFDVYDGDELFGTSVFQLASDKSLLFWGGERAVPIWSIKKQDIKSGRTMSMIQMQATMERPMLDFRIAAGPAGRSKCGWASVRFKGTGPIKRRSRARGFINSLLDAWEHLYLSLNGEGLHFFSSRNAVEPLSYLPLKAIKSFALELADTKKDKKSTVMEDKFVVVIHTAYWDVIHIRFPLPTTRENWVRTIVQGYEYVKDPLQMTKNNLQRMQSTGMASLRPRGR